MHRHYYAAQSPQGFANQVNVHIFWTKSARDLWVARHANDGDVNSASRGAYCVTAKQAHAILTRRSDAVTQQYNQLLDWHWRAIHEETE